MCRGRYVLCRGMWKMTAVWCSVYSPCHTLGSIQTPYLACRACAQGAASPHACQGRLGQARPSIATEPEPEQAGGPGQPVAHFQPCPRPACPNATWPRHASDWQAFLRPEQLFPLPCPAGCPSALPACSRVLSGCPSFPLPESLCVFLPLVRCAVSLKGCFKYSRFN